MQQALAVVNTSSSSSPSSSAKNFLSSFNPHGCADSSIEMHYSFSFDVRRKRKCKQATTYQFYGSSRCHSAVEQKRRKKYECIRCTSLSSPHAHKFRSGVINCFSPPFQQRGLVLLDYTACTFTII